MINQVNLLSSLVAQTSSLRDRLATVQEQISSGFSSDTYAGLGNKALTAVSLSPQIATQGVYQTNISVAQGRLQITQGALTQVNGIASSFFAKVNSFNASDPQSIENLSTAATSALQQMADLLNTKNGSVYVFAGTDTSNPPVTTDDPATLSSELLASDSLTAPPFSATLSTTAPKVQIGDGQFQTVGILANKNAYSTSTAPTTGSYMRDIMKSLASLSQLGSDPTPQATVSTVRNQLSSAITALGVDTGALGGIQSTLTQQQTNLTTLTSTLSSQLSDAQEVDVAAAITKSQQLQTQLQASYEVIASTSQLSLANYLQV